MQLSLDPRDLLRILWHRRWFFVIPATAILALTVALMLLLPPVYRSDATILIEDQDVPSDLVPSLFTDYIDRRLEILTRRVLQRETLTRLIEGEDLYPVLRRETTMSDIAERMRDDIATEVLSAEVNQPGSGRPGEATVGFRISFAYPAPEKARRVVDQLVSLYLSTNLESRRDVASQTATFFEGERADVDARIDRVENDIAEFQSENRELLPEEAAFKRDLLANVEQQLQNLDRDLRSLRERESFLTTQLTLTEEFEEPGAERRFGDTPESQLERVQADLATAQARYSESHPDVVRLERELRSLRAVVGARAGVGRLAEREQALVSEFAALRERYTDNHPDVVRVRRELDSVRDAMAGGGDTGETSSRSRNSSYVQLSAQLNSVQTEIQAISEQRAELRARRAELQDLLARAPQVERRYRQLQRELESAIAERDTLSQKASTVQLSGALETQAMGEQLVLAEPASLPSSPESPNKKIMLALGLVLATAGGGLAVVSAELLDRSVRSATDLARILGDAPLSVIPTITSPRERRRIWAMRLGTVGVICAFLVAGAVWIDQRMVPLDVLGFQALNRAEVWILGVFPNDPG